MHWLEKFRREYVRKDGSVGISRKEFAGMVKLKYGNCSAKLIAIIEGGGITHPRIANQIAIVTGVSPALRDKMVHKNYRGGWEPPRPKRRSEHKKPTPPLAIDVIPDHARRVVAIDISGKEIGRFESEREAANAAGCTQTTVSNRCNRVTSAGTGEFRFFDCTWRFAEEWDAMTEFERAADIENARKIKKGRKKGHEPANDYGQVPEACPANQPG